MNMLPLYELGRREPVARIAADGMLDRPADALPRVLFADVPVQLHLSVDVTLAPLRMADADTGPAGTFDAARDAWLARPHATA